MTKREQSASCVNDVYIFLYVTFHLNIHLSSVFIREHWTKLGFFEYYLNYSSSRMLFELFEHYYPDTTAKS